jgi:hypothetical protein
MVIGPWFPTSELPAAGTTVQARGVAAESDLAELSSVRTLLEELTTRVVRVADRYKDTPDSSIAAELYTAERGLIGSRRSIDRTITSLGGSR